jgi:hypothetical protein
MHTTCDITVLFLPYEPTDKKQLFTIRSIEIRLKGELAGHFEFWKIDAVWIWSCDRWPLYKNAKTCSSFINHHQSDIAVALLQVAGRVITEILKLRFEVGWNWFTLLRTKRETERKKKELPRLCKYSATHYKVDLTGTPEQIYIVNCSNRLSDWLPINLYYIFNMCSGDAWTLQASPELFKQLPWGRN